MMKGFNLFLLIVALPLFTLSQVPQYQSLQPGDRMPDIMLRNIANYEMDSARISDFRGKLLIFDFWTVYCPSCIRAMPHMEALQKQFGNQIQIILVTDSKSHQVARLMERSDIARNVKLPSIIGDTILTRLFQFRTVPTHVWIDEAGYVSQFTGPYTDAGSIGDHLAGKKIKFPLKKEYRDFDMNVPLMEEGNGRQLKHIQYYSALFGRIDHWGSMNGLILDDNRKVIGYKLVNQSLISLYSYAYASKDIPTGDYNRIVVESAHPDLVGMPADQNGKDYIFWKSEHSYSYESRVPVESRKRLKLIMQQDLQRWFGLKASIEPRRMKCLVLTCRDTALLDNRYADKGLEFPVSEYQALVVNAQNVHQLRSALNDFLYFLKTPIVTDIAYSGPFRFNLHVARNRGFESFEKALAEYGLFFREEIRKLNVLVIRD